MSGEAPIFVSYNHNDQAWAVWVAAQLRAAGHEVRIQDSDIKPGHDFLLKMEQFLDEMGRMVAIVSGNYWQSDWAMSEWRAAFAKDVAGDKGFLIPVRVEECRIPALYDRRVYVDFVGKPADHARLALLEAVGVHVAREGEVPFPGSVGGSAASAARYPVPEVFSVPHQRNDFFTGREEILSSLQDALSATGMAGITQAITGLGGIGKTQTALEFCYRHRSKYEYILWAQADQPTSLDRDYTTLATKLGLTPETAKADESREAIKQWLSREPSYLLVLDNADDPTWVRDYLPPSPTGHILITSRAPNLVKLGVKHPSELQSWPEDEAVEFLLERTSPRRPSGEKGVGGRAGGSLTTEPQPPTPDAQRLNATRIAATIGNLPLALEQAAAYIVETECSLEDYAADLARHGLTFADHHLPEIGPERRISTTWLLNFEKVEAESPAAADALRCAAFLAPEKIPYELFEVGAQHLGPNLSALDLTGRTAVAQRLAPLRRFSLVILNGDNRSFDVHRMVQEIVKSGLPAKDREGWQKAVFTAVKAATPTPKFEGWFNFGRLIPHVRFVLEEALKGGDESSDVSFLLNKTALFLYGRAEYEVARPLYEQALAIREKVSGPEHPDTATSLNNLALLLKAQGSLSAARALYERALAIREKIPGPKHRDIATSLNNLGGLLFAQGDFSAARPLLERALAIRENSLGPEDTETAQVINNLARVLQAQGDLSAARPLYERALGIYEKVQPPEHPDTATSLMNLGAFLHQQGETERAIPLLRRAVAAFEKSLPPGHPSTELARQYLAIATGETP